MSQAQQEPKIMTVAEIAALCGAQLSGSGVNADARITRIASLEEADASCVSWIANSSFSKQLETSRAGVVLGTQALLGDFPRGLITNDAENAIATLLDAFYDPPHAPAVGIHPSAIVHETARISATASIAAGAVIGPGSVVEDRAIIHEGVSLGKDVFIGADSVLFDRCVVYDRCRIGARVTLHAGVVIGCDGFGYIFRDGRHRKLMHVGTVHIEDDVEVGANTCIDRGKLGPTVVGRGTKIDNLVQIAHNVQLGPNCIVVAQVGFAGSVRAGAGVVVGGQAGFKESITIGNGAQIGAQAGVMGDVEAGATVLGSPARPFVKCLREIAAVTELPQLLKKVAALEKRVKELEGAADD